PETGRVTGIYHPDDKPGTLISYTHDADGNVLAVEYPDGKTIRQTFNNHGVRTSLTDAAGAKTVYSYNPDGTMKNAVQGGQDSRKAVQVTYTYDGLGRIETVVRGDRDSKDHVTTAYTYAGLKQIRTEKTTGPGRKAITEAAYEYDSHGNLTHRTDTRPGTASDGSPGPMTRTSTGYRYDAYNRLLGSEVKDHQGAVLSSAAYTLNVSGDVTRTETTGPDGTRTDTVHTIDPAGRLTAVTVNGTKTEQTWDSEGSLLTDHRGNTYTYDPLSRPLTATTPDGHKTTYTYWADGTRATTTTGGGSTSGEASGTGSEQITFHYTPDGTLANDTHTTPGPRPGATTASYLLAGTRHARTLTGTSAHEANATGGGYLLHDRHGSTTALTNPDGTVNAAWNYTDYGQPADHTGTPAAIPGDQSTSASRNPFTYSGEYTNPDGTQYLKARTYDPSLARFTTADPAPQFNRYQAFDTNPVNYTDPSGNTAVPDTTTWLGLGFAIFSVAAAIFATVATLGIAPVLTMAGLVTGLASAALDLTVAVNSADKFIENDDIVRGLQWAALGLGIAGAVTGVANAALGAAAKIYGRLNTAFKIEKDAFKDVESIASVKSIQKQADIEMDIVRRDFELEFKTDVLHQAAKPAKGRKSCAAVAVAFDRCDITDQVSFIETDRVLDHATLKKQANLSGNWTEPGSAEQVLDYMSQKPDGTKFIVMGEMANAGDLWLGSKIFPGDFGHFFNAENMHGRVKLYDAFINKTGDAVKDNMMGAYKGYTGKWRAIVTGNSST
ncbi:RHS repeat-associated core domain-containing protein, partial [Streptomyces sp. NPDC001774]